MNILSSIGTANFFKRAIFFFVIIGLAIINLFGNFRGINHPVAMEHAQTGREIARGNGFSTKVVYPASLNIAAKKGKTVDFTNQKNTVNAPAYPVLIGLVFKLVDGGNYDKYVMAPNQHIHTLDRLLAALALLFFILTIASSYILLIRMFDEKIAALTAGMMILSQLMWDYVLTCLPQMFMMFLFSLIIHITWSALTRQENEKKPILEFILIGILFGTLILTSWLTAWLFIGYFIFSLIYFKPRGVIAAILLIIVVGMSIPALIYYHQATGSYLGVAGVTSMSGLHGSQDFLLRNSETISISLKSIFLNIASLSLNQITHLFVHMGGLVAVPVFFISFLHHFKRNSLNKLKVGVILMWSFSVLGMAIYGLNDHETSQNQLHILFVPLMCGFGIAMIALIWARSELSGRNNMLNAAPMTLIFLISAGPVIVKLPESARNAAEIGKNGRPNTPYYHAKALNIGLHNTLKNSRRDSKKPPVIFSDQPRAVAWYADMHAIYLPINHEQILKVENIAAANDNPISGIHTSAVSTKPFYENIETREYLNLFGIIYSPIFPSITGQRFNTYDIIAQENSISPLKPITQTYDKKKFMFHNDNSIRDYGYDVFYSRYSSSEE